MYAFSIHLQVLKGECFSFHIAATSYLFSSTRFSAFKGKRPEKLRSPFQFKTSFQRSQLELFFFLCNMIYSIYHCSLWKDLKWPCVSHFPRQYSSWEGNRGAPRHRSSLQKGQDSRFDNLLLFWHQRWNSLELRAGAVLCTAAWHSGIFHTFCWNYSTYCHCDCSTNWFLA